MSDRSFRNYKGKCICSISYEIKEKKEDTQIHRVIVMKNKQEKSGYVLSK